MRDLVFRMSILCIAAICVSAARADTVPVSPVVKDMLTSTLENYIQPAYLNLEAATKSFNSTADLLCEKPATQNLEAVRSAFRDVAYAWSQIEWLRVGPVMDQNRLERILYYPDRKSIGLRQVQRALAKEEPSVVSVETLSKKSVAMQGLGAADFLLSGTGNEVLVEEAQSHRCNYLAAIAENLHVLSTEISSQWSSGQPLAEAWLLPNQDNLLFRDDLEAKNFLIGTLIHGLEAIKDVRIGAFLRESAERDRPKSALFWRSALTMHTIAGNLAGMQKYYEDSELYKLLPEENAYLNDEFLFEMKNLIEVAGSLDMPISNLLEEEAARGKLAFLQLSVGFLVTKLDGPFASAAGLAAGFSFGDGD
ncbi:MAG: imelysin family protein [Pseudomonadota bacterium]